MARQGYFPGFSGMIEALLEEQARRIRFEEATIQMTWVLKEREYQRFD
jgi:hypothetical protein